METALTIISMDRYYRFCFSIGIGGVYLEISASAQQIIQDKNLVPRECLHPVEFIP